MPQMLTADYVSLIIYIMPMNFGFKAGSTGNLLAIPTFLARFRTVLPGGIVKSPPMISKF
jgi:hypothetical protein